MAKKSEASVSVEEIDIDHKEARVYELGFHIDPDLSSEEVKKTYQSIREVASKAGVATSILASLHGLHTKQMVQDMKQ